MMKTKLILDKNVIVPNRYEWLKHVAGIIPDFSDDPTALTQVLREREKSGAQGLRKSW